MYGIRFLFGFSFYLLSFSTTGQTQVIDSLRSLLTSDESVQNVDIMNSISRGLIYTQPKEALRYIDVALDLSQKLDYEKGRSLALINRAVIEGNTFELGKAQTTLEEAIQSAEKVGFDEGLAYARLSLVVVFMRKASYDSALQLSYSSLEAARTIENPDLEVSNLINIGAILQSFNDLEGAKQQYQEALDIAENNAGVAKARTGQLNVNMGVIYATQKNFGLAIEAYEQALGIFRDLNMKDQIAHTLMNLGYCQAAIGLNKKAMTNYDQSEALWAELGNLRNQAFVLKNKGELMAANARNNKAVSYYQTALDILENRDQKLGSEINLKLSEAYEKTGKHQLALAAYKMHVYINDSLNTVSNEKSIAALTKAHNVERFEQEADLKDQLNQIQSLKIWQRNVVILICVVIIVLLVVWLRIKRKEFKTRLIITNHEKKIVEQETAIKSAAFLNEKAKLQEDLSSLADKNRLLEERSGSNGHHDFTHDELEQLVKKLRQSIEGEKDWTTFQLYFDSLYPDLIEKIKAVHSVEFTQYEQRLIALIRIGLSNKEVADVLSISRNSVVRAKSRLREKIGFEETRQLEEFINSI